jgi:hypothetical protein
MAYVNLLLTCVNLLLTYVNLLLTYVNLLLTYVNLLMSYVNLLSETGVLMFNIREAAVWPVGHWLQTETGSNQRYFSVTSNMGIIPEIKYTNILMCPLYGHKMWLASNSWWTTGLPNYHLVCFYPTLRCFSKGKGQRYWIQAEERRKFSKIQLFCGMAPCLLKSTRLHTRRHIPDDYL